MLGYLNYIKNLLVILLFMVGLGLISACPLSDANKQGDKSDKPEIKPHSPPTLDTPPPTSATPPPPLTIKKVLEDVHGLIATKDDVLADKFVEDSKKALTDKNRAKAALETEHEGSYLLNMAVQSKNLDRILPELERILNLVDAADASNAINRVVAGSSPVESVLKGGDFNIPTLVLFSKRGADANKLNDVELETYFKRLCYQNPFPVVEDARLKQWLTFAFAEQAAEAFKCLLDKTPDPRLKGNFLRLSTEEAKKAALAQNDDASVSTDPVLNKFLNILNDRFGIAKAGVSDPEFNVVNVIIETLEGTDFKDARVIKLIELAIGRVKYHKLNGAQDWNSYIKDALAIAEGKEGLNDQMRAKILLGLTLTPAFLVDAAEDNSTSSSVLKTLLEDYLKQQGAKRELWKSLVDYRKEPAKQSFLSSIAQRQGDEDTRAIFKLVLEAPVAMDKAWNSDEETILDLLIAKGTDLKAIANLYQKGAKIKKDLSPKELKTLLSAINIHDRNQLSRVMKTFITTQDLRNATAQWVSENKEPDDDRIKDNLVEALRSSNFMSLLPDTKDKEEFLKASKALITHQEIADFALKENLFSRLIKADLSADLDIEFRRLLSLATPEKVEKMLKKKGLLQTLVGSGSKNGVKLLLERGVDSSELNQFHFMNLLALLAGEKVLLEKLHAELLTWREEKRAELFHLALSYKGEGLKALYGALETQEQKQLIGLILEDDIKQQVKSGFELRMINFLLSFVDIDAKVILSDGSEKNLFGAAMTLLSRSPLFTKDRAKALVALFRPKFKSEDWPQFSHEALKLLSAPQPAGLGSKIEAQLLLGNYEEAVQALIDDAKDQSIDGAELLRRFRIFSPNPSSMTPKELLVGGFVKHLVNRTIDKPMAELIEKISATRERTPEVLIALSDALNFLLKGPREDDEPYVYYKQSINNLINAGATPDLNVPDVAIERLFDAVGDDNNRANYLLKLIKDEESAAKYALWSAKKGQFKALQYYLSSSSSAPIREAIFKTAFAQVFEGGTVNLADLDDLSSLIEEHLDFKEKLTGDFYSLDQGLTTGTMAYWLAKKLDLKDQALLRKLKDILGLIKKKGFYDEYEKRMLQNEFKWQDYLATKSSSGESVEQLLLDAGIEKAAAREISHDMSPVVLGSPDLAFEEQLIYFASDPKITNRSLYNLLSDYLAFKKLRALREAQWHNKKFLSELLHNRKIDWETLGILAKLSSSGFISKFIYDPKLDGEYILDALLKDRSAYKDENESFKEVLKSLLSAGARKISLTLTEQALLEVLKSLFDIKTTTEPDYWWLLSKHAKTAQLLKTAARVIIDNREELAVSALAHYLETLKTNGEHALVQGLEEGLTEALLRRGFSFMASFTIDGELEKFKLNPLANTFLNEGETSGLLFLALKKNAADLKNELTQRSLKKLAKSLKQIANAEGVDWANYSQPAYEYLVKDQSFAEADAKQLLLRD